MTENKLWLLYAQMHQTTVITDSCLAFMPRVPWTPLTVN